MEIYSIIDNLINEYNPRKTRVFLETIILRLLEAEARKQSKPFTTYYLLENEINSKFHDFDAYAPEGLFDLIGPTAFEVKVFTKKESLYYLTNKTINNKQYIKIEKTGLKNIVFIVTLDLDEEEKSKFINRIEILDKKVIIWDRKWLDKIIEDNNGVYNDISSNINEIVLNNKINNNIKESKHQWKETRKAYVDGLKEKYQSDDLVLVLGAGVSQRAGIPSWNKLVTELLVSLIEKKLTEHSVSIGEDERSLLIEELKKENANSPLLQTRYIRAGLKKDFYEILNTILYTKCSNTSKLLSAITKLSQPQRNIKGIKAIVTFNFDDLIEYNLSAAEIKHKSLFRDSDIQVNDALSIFHVHGYLPRNGLNQDEVKDSLLVFSEEGYHNVMTDPYHWSNLIQLNFLRENTCLFLGLSMTDPNLRRLLEISTRKRISGDCQHYAILKRENILIDSKSKNSKENRAITKFNSVNYGIQEEVLKELGVNILWVEDFDEIPSILDKIRK